MQEMGREKDYRETLVSDLLMGVQMETMDFPMKKRLAVERYMRKFLRSLTTLELEIAHGLYERQSILTPDIEYKVTEASEGYDDFMYKRRNSY